MCSRTHRLQVDMNDPLAGEAIDLHVTVQRLGNDVVPDRQVTLDLIPEPLHVPNQIL